MKSLSLKSFFIAICAVLFITLTINIFATHRSGQTSTELLTSVQDHDFPVVVELHKLLGHGLQAEQATRNIILNKDDQRAEKNYLAAHSDFRSSLETLARLDASMRDAVQPLSALWDKSHILRQKAQEMGKNDNQSGAVALINKEETPIWRDIKDNILTLIDKKSKEINKNIADKSITMGVTQNAAIAVACLVLILVVFMLIAIWRKIVKPIREVSTYVVSVSGGNYKASIDTSSYIYEFKSMADCVQSMTETLKEKLSLAQGVVSGIATPFAIIGKDGKLQSLTPAAVKAFGRAGSAESYIGKQYAALADRGDRMFSSQVADVIRTREPFSGLNEVQADDGLTRALISNLSPILSLEGNILGVAASYLDVTDIKRRESEIEHKNELLAAAATSAEKVSESVRRQTSGLASHMDNARMGAEQQAVQVCESASSISQMNVSILEVAHSASKAATTSDTAKDKAQLGSVVVSDVINGISEVQGQALDLKKNMTELGQQAAGIGTILSVISDIADQTNLLALNAAIEAARAGDAGRGFAVVADEVRKLAEKTMNATREVEAVVTGIQSGATANTEKVDQAVSAIENATKLSQSAGASLQEIVELVENVSTQVHSIATAAEEQSVASEQIARSVDTVSTICQNTAEIVVSSTNAIELLVQESNELKSLIDNMRLAS